MTGDPGASREYDADGGEVRAWGVNQAVVNSAFGLPASGRWADLQVFREMHHGFPECHGK